MRRRSQWYADPGGPALGPSRFQPPLLKPTAWLYHPHLQRSLVPPYAAQGRGLRRRVGQAAGHQVNRQSDKRVRHQIGRLPNIQVAPAHQNAGSNRDTAHPMQTLRVGCAGARHGTRILVGRHSVHRDSNHHC